MCYGRVYPENGAMRLYVQSLNLHDLVKGVVKNMAVKFHKQGVKVDLDLQASNPNLVADRIHLTNILFNVIDNAVKYFPAKTRTLSFGRPKFLTECHSTSKTTGLASPKNILARSLKGSIVSPPETCTT